MERRYHRRLFVDDRDVADSRNVTRIMHSAEKHPANPLVQSMLVSGSVLYDDADSRFKIWSDRFLNFSEDGLHWEKKPISQLPPPPGGSRRALSNVVKDTADVSEKRFKATQPFLPSGAPLYTYYPVYSSDGCDWTSVTEDVTIQLPGLTDVFTAGSQEMVTAVPPADRVNAVCDVGGEAPPRFFGVIRRSDPLRGFEQRVLTVSTSEDWIHWSEPELVLTTDERDDEMADGRLDAALDSGIIIRDEAEDRRCETYCLYPFPYEDLYIGILFIFDANFEYKRLGSSGNQGGIMEAQLAASRDLKNWERLGDRRSFISRGEPGEFDCGRVCYTGPPVVKGDCLWFFYSGEPKSHAGGRDEEDIARLQKKVDSGLWSPLEYSMGLAVLRRDGFVSLRAGDAEGRVTTRPFIWQGEGLCVNVDAGRGDLKTEILGADGSTVPEFTASKCRSIREDTCSWKISWGADPRSLDGREVSLRFVFRNADLYSYWLV